MSLLWASAHALHALIDHVGRHPHSTFLAARSARGARGKKATGLQISARMTILAFWKAYRGHEGRRSRTEKTPPKARNKASRLTLNLVQLASEGVTLLSLLLRSRLTPKKRVEMPFLWLLDYIVWTNISKVNTLTFSYNRLTYTVYLAQALTEQQGLMQGGNSLEWRQEVVGVRTMTFLVNVLSRHFLHSFSRSTLSLY